jgi:hypothetical protein
MDSEGFKFTFYVKPFYKNPENATENIQEKPRSPSRKRAVLAPISNRSINQSSRPLSHNNERQDFRYFPRATHQMAESYLSSSFFPKEKSSTYKSPGSVLQDLNNIKEKDSTFKVLNDGKKNIKLFPVIHYYRKPRGFTPGNILRCKLQL